MDVKKVNGSGNGNAANEWRVKVGLAEMLKGGVIMDVTNAEQAQIAEKAGACAVMALERVPSDIRKEGGVARMASIKIIREIMKTVTIPVMAKVRIGHFIEAEVLQALEVDFIDESVCVWRAQFGRSAAPHRGRRGHDSHQGRGRLRQCGGGRAAHAHHC